MLEFVERGVPYLLDWVILISMLVILNWPLYLVILKALAHFLKPPTFSLTTTTYQIPKISIVVPTYNEATLIKKKIENISSYDYPKDKIEVIIVNDGSTDHTNDVLKNLDTMDTKSSVRVIETPHMGMSHARWRGSIEASGDYILWSDVDSVQVEDALLTGVKNLAQPSIGCVCGIYYPEKFSVRSAELSMKNIVQVLEGSIDSCFYVTGTFFLFRRIFVKDINKKVLNNDAALAISIRKRGYRVITDPSIVSHHKKEPLTLIQHIKRKHTVFFTLLEVLSKNYDIILNPKFGFYGLIILPRSLLVCLQPIALLSFCTSILIEAILNNFIWHLFVIVLVSLFGYLMLKLFASKSGVFQLLRNILAYFLADFFNILAYIKFIRMHTIFR